MRIGWTDELAPWMRDVNKRVEKLERRREPPVYVGPMTIWISTVRSIPPGPFPPNIGYLPDDTGTVWVWRDGVLTDEDEGGQKITPAKFFERP